MSLRARILAYVVVVMAIVSVMVIATITPDTLHDKSTALASGREAADALQALFQKLTAAQRQELANSRQRLFADQHVLEGWVLVGKDGKVHYWGMQGERQEKIDTAVLVAHRF